jgi:large conductance mechanosensitive channel
MVLFALDLSMKANCDSLLVVKFYKLKTLKTMSREKDNLAKDDEMLDELKKIRGLLEPKPAPLPPKGLWSEFKAFIESYKVLGIAVAFIMGLYLGGLVQSLVSDLLLPVIGLAIPGLGNLATWKIPVPDVSLDAQGNPPAGYAGQIFGIGPFLAALITFIIVALVIFLIVKVASKWGLK